MQALPSLTTRKVTAPLVFAGYGLVVPESQNFGYDSYAGLDVKDKIVLVLHYFPEDTDPKTKAALARYSDLRYKALAARQRARKGLLVVTGPRSPNAGQTLRMTFDTALSGSGIPAATISGAVANRAVCRRTEVSGRGAGGARFGQSARRRLPSALLRGSDHEASFARS